MLIAFQPPQPPNTESAPSFPLTTSGPLFADTRRPRARGGNDELLVLAPDGDPDLLSCGSGEDKAFVLREERSSTHLVGCETLFIVVELTADQQEGENADADAEADG